MTTPHYYIRTWTHGIGYEFVGGITRNERGAINGVVLVLANDAPYNYPKDEADAIASFIREHLPYIARVAVVASLTTIE